jgi:phospholipid N-methyltransferase
MIFPDNIPGVTPESELLPYLKIMHPYFSVVSDKTVMEIGPQFGWHTALSLSYDPKSITLIENDINVAELLNEDHKNNNKVTVIQDDIYHHLTVNNTKYDVVVCCGVLYHFHSPFHLLELIANQCDPETIIIEYPYDATKKLNDISFGEEQINVLAERWVNRGWKPIGLRVLISSDLLITSMKQLGYELIELSDDIQKGTSIIKVSLYIFKKI